MSTPKILSLEEIEKWQDIAEKYKYYELFDHINEDGLKALLATARAYHELKDKTVDSWTYTISNPEDMADAPNEDKPHAPTIKLLATIARKSGYYSLAESLESILKEL